MANTAAPSCTGKCINDCGDSTFSYPQNGNARPLIADCQTIGRNVDGGGTWTVDVNTDRIIVSYGTCGLNVNGGSTTQVQFKVGNSDVISLINTSIEKFANTTDGTVAANGEMNCQGTTSGIADVVWSIFLDE